MEKTQPENGDGKALVAGTGSAPPSHRGALPRVAMAGALLLAVLVVSGLIYRAWPFGLLLLGLAGVAWLLWAIAHALLPHAQPHWLPRAIAGGMWLLYAMQLVYRWRLEMGYWHSLGLMFGWAFFSALLCTALVAWGARWWGKT